MIAHDAEKNVTTVERGFHPFLRALTDIKVVVIERRYRHIQNADLALKVGYVQDLAVIEIPRAFAIVSARLGFFPALDERLHSTR